VPYAYTYNTQVRVYLVAAGGETDLLATGSQVLYEMATCRNMSVRALGQKGYKLDAG
jgi:hypothetical protein